VLALGNGRRDLEAFGRVITGDHHSWFHRARCCAPLDLSTMQQSNTNYCLCC
jgi:hypothetical protein